jgi:hypothetical protein
MLLTAVHAGDMFTKLPELHVTTVNKHLHFVVLILCRVVVPVDKMRFAKETPIFPRQKHSGSRHRLFLDDSIR